MKDNVVDRQEQTYSEITMNTSAVDCQVCSRNETIIDSAGLQFVPHNGHAVQHTSKATPVGLDRLRQAAVGQRRAQ